jgi:hypothetical protein
MSMIEKTCRVDPSSARKWLPWINGKEAQDMAEFAIAREWHRVDPENAMKWIETTSLAEHVKQRYRSTTPVEKK